VTAYNALRQALRARHGVATAFEVRKELEAYRASLPRPKPMGEGDLCVADTKGHVRMMTRADYGEMVYGRRKKARKKRNKDGDLVLAYVAQDSIEVEAVLTENFIAAELVTQHTKDTDWIDEIARKHQQEIDDNQYHGEW
jgi:hypothetical protein